MDSEKLKQVNESLNTNVVETIPTNELVKELQRRRAIEIPKLVQEVNDRLKQIKALVGNITNETEPIILKELRIIESGSNQGSVEYTEDEITL